MKRQLQTWKLVDKSLCGHVPVMLLYVLQSEGSSPGRQGFLMALNGQDETAGSIGGGIMEHKFIEMSRDKLRQQDPYMAVHPQHHDKIAPRDQSGMICSGTQTILVYRMEPHDAPSVQRIVACLEEYKNGTLQFSPEGLHFADREIPEENYAFTWHSDKQWSYTEKIGFKNRLFIVGGGHCALALSRLMQDMDFYVHLFDDRSELATFDRNNYADQKTIIRDYHALNHLIPSGNNHYVVVMTVGYRTDGIAMRALFGKEFKYVGMLGSSAKIEKMLADFRATAIPEAYIEQIHAPIGIPIKSQTPEEIAVSIAAQIIQVKNASL